MNLSEDVYNVVKNIKNISNKLDINNLLQTVSSNVDYVLLGECTHGTEEFYKIRSDITKNLIKNNNFKIVLVEGNWPSLYRVNQYISCKDSKDKSAEESLESINTYPLWMWKNDVISELIEWIRNYNLDNKNDIPVRFLGIDCYQLLEARKIILNFLKKVDIEFYNEIKDRYSFLDNFKNEQEYGFSVIHGSLKPYSDKIQNIFQKYQSFFQWEKFDKYLKICKEKNINLFDLISVDQCFELIVNADEYYRKLFSEPKGSQASWNIRDQHMTMTVLKLKETLKKVYNDNSKMIIWAHNSHVGDSNATNRGGDTFKNNNTWNLGQMCRSTFKKENVRIFGFYTYQGEVRASTEWDKPSKKFILNNSLKYSYEWFFHQVTCKYNLPSFFIDIKKLNIKHPNNNILIYNLPCKYKFVNNLNEIRETEKLDSKVIRKFKVDEEFIAIDRKIIDNHIIRLKLDTGGWVTEFISIGHIKTYCLPIDYQYTDNMKDFFNLKLLQRWIGVNYCKKSEINSHYGETSMGRQYDTIIFIDKTSELKPLTKKRNDLKKFMGIKRLAKEYKTLLSDPIDNIEAHPDESNMFMWYYLIRGTEEPYKGGYYYGKVIFPDEYPLKPPKILMLTPNGRFETNKELCLSISNYHPESWNPAWTIETILIGLYSFMLEEEQTLGSINGTFNERKIFAEKSLDYNKKNKKFIKFFLNNIQKCKVKKNDESSLQCRYCFNNDKEENLVAPCECKGDQKYVHLECLRKWQKSVLISQSTHPDQRTNIDETCNVCLTKFKIKPPDRYEMMLKYAGNEMANLLIPGTLIVSDKTVSENNLENINKFKSDRFLYYSVLHWTYGLYFIVNIVKNNNSLDNVVGVDLSRPLINLPEKFYTLDKKILNIKKIWKKYDYIKKIEFIELNYYLGGPCNPELGFGLTIIKNIKNFNLIANKYLTVIPVLKNTLYKDHIVIYGLLENVVEVIKYYYGNINKTKINIDAFVGVAGWSRTQLLGEISRRHWGLCKTKIEDLIEYKDDKWENIYNSGRVIVAESSEYSEV